MSRGPGEVMRKVLGLTAVIEEECHAYPTYRGLASLVYETKNPSRAQLSAVARAARRLEQDGLIEIYAYADDQRERVVGLSPWVPLALLILESEEWDPRSTWYGDLAELAQASRELAEMGIIEGTRNGERIDPLNRPLIIDGRRG